MATDRVLIEELSALLDTRDECWTKKARAFDKDDCVVPAETIEDVFVVSSDPPLDNDTSIKWDGQGFVSCRRSNTKDTRTMKRKIRQQKEAVRKRRYQERLKNERETLRRMETELSQQLRTLEREADSRKRAALDKLAHASSIWRQRAHQERGQRLQAENEQKRLVTAVSVQASYLVNLQELLPCIDQEARLAIASSITMNTQTNHILYEEHLQRVEAGYN
ncbi:unnamed protein product [Phytophthora lilii]|uniref:Unnamed protein product n=1 Tax=Phytophthora lilii TaxID=2077276 RepID=A0A9W6U1Y6_9STRA|nr:unnamed protein product [Phytophthora lilii]